MPEQNPQQHQELASFGEELRREREIRGISLKEIADATKISRRFLEAIERNDHKTLPAPVFTRGFVREYARYLGLNTEEMVNRYNFGAAGDDRVENDPHLERLVHPELTEIPKKELPPPYLGIPASAYLTLLVVLALAGVTWWAVSTKQARVSRQPIVAPAPPTTITAPAPREAVTEEKQAPLDDSRLYLSMEVTRNSWVTLEVDGETVVNDELRAGTTRTFEADRQFRFRSIGNAAGVTLTLNDTPVPPLGREGEVVRNRILDRDSLERLRRSEAPR